MVRAGRAYDEGRSESARAANEFQIATDLKRSTIQVAMCSSVAYSVLGVSLYPVVSGYEPNDFELDIVSGKSSHTVMPGIKIGRGVLACCAARWDRVL